jgi:hypothetical protein
VKCSSSKLPIFCVVAFALCACSEAPTSNKPWQGFATNIQTGKQEWFFNIYAAYDDCMFVTKQTIDSQSNWYRAPYGCLYDGYQNPYVQWVVNKTIAGNSFRCIARSTDPEVQKAGKFYGPVLRDSPVTSGKDWYCVVP